MPDVISLGGLLIPVLRAATLAALLIAPWWAARIAGARSLDGHWVNTVATNAGWVGLSGARVGFVIANWEAYQVDPVSALYVWQPGYLPWAGALSRAVFALTALRALPRDVRGGYASALGAGFALGAGLLGAVYASRTLRPDPNPLGAASGGRVAGANRAADGGLEIRLMNLKSQPVVLSSLRGRGVVLNFWATWCPPCRREMPMLETLNEEYATRGLTVVGIDLDEPFATVEGYIREGGYRYPIWVDAIPGLAPGGFDRTRTLFNRYGGLGLPTTLFIDANGRIVSSVTGELSRGILASNAKAILPMAK